VHAARTPFVPRGLARARLGLLAGGGALILIAGACNNKAKELDSNDRERTAAAGKPAPPLPGADGGGRGETHRRVDWTFDAEDPGRDYVGRYLRATLRYGRDTACVLLGKSNFRNGEAVIEVRNPADSTCGPPGALRDTFVADVAIDRIKLDDPSHQAPLRAWPDGSAPDGPPSEVADVQNLVKWRSPLHDAIKKQQLWPLRIQLYGRGTYPVVSIAGWHGTFDPKGDVEALKGAARDLCVATDQSPLGFVTGQGGAVEQMLRIDCPANPHWERL
jgi:hypothetical protein